MKNICFLFSLVVLSFACSDDSDENMISELEVKFESNMTVVMEGTLVQFADKSTGSPTEWEWTFEGGSPVSSTDKSPKVTYSKEGEYSVALTIRNKNGEKSNTKTAFIKVIPDFSENLIAHYEFNQELIIDLSGNSLDGDAINIQISPSWAWFDGTAFVRVEHDALFDVEEFTVTVVMNQSLHDPSPAKYLFSKDNSILVGINQDNTIFMEVYLENDNEFIFRTTETIASTNFGDDSFNFLSFTYGAEEASIGKNLTYISNTSIPADAILTNNNDVYMATKNGLSGFLVGALLDVRFYDRVLSEDELTSLYQFEYETEEHPN